MHRSRPRYDMGRFKALYPHASGARVVEHGTKHKHAVPAAKPPDGAVRSTAGKKEGSPPTASSSRAAVGKAGAPSSSSGQRQGGNPKR